MTTVLLGNTAPLDAEPGQEPGTVKRLVPTSLGGNTITGFDVRKHTAGEANLALSTDNDPVLNVIRAALEPDQHRYALAVAEVNDAWNVSHSEDPPEWVESDDAGLAKALVRWFSKAGVKAAGADLDLLTIVANPQNGAVLGSFVKCRDHEVRLGRPDGWHSIVDRPPLGGGALGTDYQPWELSEDAWLYFRQADLLTTVGKDALHDQHLKVSSQPVGFGYMALANSGTATTPAIGDTVLTGEITTAGGGLLRAAATYAHTGGASTSTLTKAFTANGSDSLPVTISQDGLLNATPTGGTLGYKTALNATATLTVSGDSATITHTITGS